MIYSTSLLTSSNGEIDCIKTIEISRSDIARSFRGWISVRANVKTFLILFVIFTIFPLHGLSEIYAGSSKKDRDVVHPDLYLHHPRVTKEFLESFKPTPLDHEMGWVIEDQSGRKFSPEKIRPAGEAKNDSPTARKPIIKNKQDFLWAENAGDLATQKNNEGLSYVIANDMDRAREIFEELRHKEPQFFPGRFNLGRIYLYFRQHREAIVEFEKSILLVPQYNRNYYFLGKAYELAGQRDAADYNFLRAYRRNIYDLESLVAFGDSLLEQKRTIEALNTFKYCLKYDSGFNDALIGMGKVAYTLKKYYDATLWFKTVDLKLSYKKELHFYYGESAFFSQDYQTAAQQYETILNFPQDAIYSKISLVKMRKRLEQTKRLLNQSVD